MAMVFAFRALFLGEKISFMGNWMFPDVGSSGNKMALPSVVTSLVDSAGSERDYDSTFSRVSIRS